MKEREAKRLLKIAEILKKVVTMVDKGSYARAVKTLEMQAKKLSESAKKTKPSKKRAASPYALFVKANYKKVAAEHPGKKAPAVMKLLAAKYHAANDSKPAKKATKSTKSKK
jgi:uncharacterized heparinase superfamily protein